MPGNAVTTTDDVVPGPHGPVPVRRYSPASGAGVAGSVPIVWVHGGAFVKGGLDLPETHEVARALAAAGFPVVTVGYRLASRLPLRRPRRLPAPARPAVRYPVPLDDVVAVVRHIQGEAPAGVILGGASAGACLSAATVLRLASGGDPELRGVFFAYGIFHAVLPPRTPELAGRLRGRRRITHRASLIGFVNYNYAGTRALMAEPTAFPGGHPVGAFPPALLIDADHDIMRASGSRFARELEAAGVPTDHHVLAGTDHAFLNRPHDPGFERGIRLIVDWARRL